MHTHTSMHRTCSTNGSGGIVHVVGAGEQRLLARCVHHTLPGPLSVRRWMASQPPSARRGLAVDVLSYYRGDVASVRQLRVDDSVPSIWCAKAAPRARLRQGNDAWVATCAKRCGSPWLKAAAGSSSSPRVRLHQQPPWSHARWNDEISAQQGLLLAWYDWARNLRCYTTSRCVTHEPACT